MITRNKSGISRINSANTDIASRNTFAKCASYNIVRMRRIIITAIVAVIIIATAGGTKMMAIPWPTYEASITMDSMCCAVITITSSNPGFSSSTLGDSVRAYYYPDGYDNGQQILVGAKRLKNGDGAITVTVCPPQDAYYGGSISSQIDVKLYFVRLMDGGIYDEVCVFTLPPHQHLPSRFADCLDTLQLDCPDQIPGCANVDWTTKTMTITVPGYPDCPVSCSYEDRFCGEIDQNGKPINGEYQIRNVRVTIKVPSKNTHYLPPMSCFALYYAITEPIPIELPEPGDGLLIPIFPYGRRIVPEKLAELNRNAFLAIADSIFVAEIITPVLAQGGDTSGLFSCDNPYQGGVAVTYTQSTCISRFAGVSYGEDGDYILISKEINCTYGACCRKTVHPCIGANGEIVNNIEYDEVGLDICPEGTTPYVDTRNLIFYYRSPCESSCGQEENE
jgi:hypothetical protein